MYNLKARLSNIIVDKEWHIPNFVTRKTPDLAELFEEIEIGDGEWALTASLT